MLSKETFCEALRKIQAQKLSLIHISEPTRH